MFTQLNLNLKNTTKYTLKKSEMSQERAYQTCLEMLKQREYEIIDQDEDAMRVTALKPDGTQMCVFFNTAPKFDTKSMKEIISMMHEMEIDHALVVYTDSITPPTKSTLAQSTEMRIELFAEEDLQYNITKHCLQPIFERLPEAEAEEFKKKFGVKFGTLRIDRPIARFYDYQRGDVIRIKRQGGYITYRIVKG